MCTCFFVDFVHGDHDKKMGGGELRGSNRRRGMGGEGSSRNIEEDMFFVIFLPRPSLVKLLYRALLFALNAGMTFRVLPWCGFGFWVLVDLSVKSMV